MSSFKIVLAFLIISCLGFLFVPGLPVDLELVSSLPALTVTFDLKSAPPEIVEQEATGPLESVLSQITQLKKISSVSGQERGRIELHFDDEADIALKKFQINAIIRQSYGKLNREITYPVVEQRTRMGEEKKPLLVYQINAKLAPFQIRKTANDILLSPISQLPGISEVIIRGAEDIRVSIAFQPEKLKQYGLELTDIRDHIQSEFRTFFPGALLTAQGERFILKGGKNLKSLEELRAVRLHSLFGSMITLGQIAQIYYEENAAHQYFRINGLNTVTLTIYADESTNRLALGQAVTNKVEQLKQRLPQGFSVLLDHDDTEFVSEEINRNILRSSLSCIVLMIFVLVSYRSLKHLATLFLAIFVSLGFTVLVAFLMSIQVHLYTIAGATISLGLIIDNSIVVIDHLKRKRNNKIFRAVLASGLSTIMALMLVLLLPEEERGNLTDFSIVVAIAIGCSALTAILFTPSLIELWPLNVNERKVEYCQKKKLLRWQLKYGLMIALITRFRKTFIGLCMLVFGLPVFLLPSTWDGHDWYNKTVGSDLYQESIRPVSDKILGGTLRLFITNSRERSGYRELQETVLHVQAELPEGNTLEEMNRVITGIESYLSSLRGINKYVSQVYSGQHAHIAISFTEQEESEAFPYDLKDRLIALSLGWDGVEWNIFGVGKGFSNASLESVPSFKIKLKGYNYDQVSLYAELLAAKLLKHKRIQKVNTNERLSWDEKNSEQLTLNIPSRMSSDHKLIEDLYRRSEISAPSFYLSVNQSIFPVHFTNSTNTNLSRYDLMQTVVITCDSQWVRLLSIAAIKTKKMTSAIHKEDRNYIKAVGFEYYGSPVFGDEYLDQVLEEMRAEMAVGYTVEKDSYQWTWDKTKRQYGILVLLALAVYFITAVQFESLKQPVVIILVIPLSFIGLFLTFSAFNVYFDQGGYAAFILLGGLVVNACIYIVNDLNNIRHGNPNTRIIRAVSGKMTSIILIITATCLGLVPFLLGKASEVFWFGLAAGTIGGLVFSLILIFIALPVFLSKKE